MEDKILNRVRKMMALANDAAASEGERDNALRMSYNLLAKYNLSMIDVEQHLPQEKREQLEAIFVSTIWARHIANDISKLFFCKYVVGSKTNAWKGKHYFIGKESNATTAMLMSEYVVTSVLRQARRLYKDDSCPEARSFAVGVCDKLRTRVRELIAAQSTDGDATPGTALVLANLYTAETDANAEFMLQIGFKTKPTKHSGKSGVVSDAYGAGKTFGAGISLVPQVGAGKNSTLRIK